MQKFQTQFSSSWRGSFNCDGLFRVLK